MMWFQNAKLQLAIIGCGLVILAVIVFVIWHAISVASKKTASLIDAGGDSNYNVITGFWSRMASSTARGGPSTASTLRLRVLA